MLHSHAPTRSRTYTYLNALNYLSIHINIQNIFKHIHTYTRRKRKRNMVLTTYQHTYVKLSNNKADDSYTAKHIKN